MGVSGTEENIEDAIKSYKIYAAKIPLQDGDYTMDHIASIILLEKGGRFHDIIKYQEDHDVALQKNAKLNRVAEQFVDGPGLNLRAT